MRSTLEGHPAGGEARDVQFNVFSDKAPVPVVLAPFSRSVGGCVLFTDGPRKDPRHTVQVSFLRRFIGAAAVCSSQRGEKHDRSR